MRPLILTTGFHLGINGHTLFHNGASENPTIGTVEDWFLINTMIIGHPMHIHLIQYEVIGEFSLKHYSVPGRITPNLPTGRYE